MRSTTRADDDARWAASTPAHFRFAVQRLKSVTHERQLVDVMPPFDDFLALQKMAAKSA